MNDGVSRRKQKNNKNINKQKSRRSRKEPRGRVK